MLHRSTLLQDACHTLLHERVELRVGQNVELLRLNGLEDIRSDLLRSHASLRRLPHLLNNRFELWTQRFARRFIL